MFKKFSNIRSQALETQSYIRNNFSNSDARFDKWVYDNCIHIEEASSYNHNVYQLPNGMRVLQECQEEYNCYNYWPVVDDVIFDDIDFFIGWHHSRMNGLFTEYQT